MRALVLMLAVSLVPAGFLSRFVRESNSEASTRRALEAMGSEFPTDAVRHFARARELAPGPFSSFNLGTAQIATGATEDGAVELERAFESEELAPEAHYNRGFGALSSEDFDAAIDEFIETLRLEPGHAAAKRNLEIALRRKQEQSTRPSEREEGQEGEQPEESPSEGDSPEDQAGEMDRILRSVEQQEQEELSRMRRAKAGPRIVDW